MTNSSGQDQWASAVDKLIAEIRELRSRDLTPEERAEAQQLLQEWGYYDKARHGQARIMVGLEWGGRPSSAAPAPEAPVAAPAEPPPEAAPPAEPARLPKPARGSIRAK